MRKSEIVFKIGKMDNSFIDGILLLGVFYYSNIDEMVDSHVVEEHFPELEELGLSDLAEGQIEYSGELSIFELSEELERRGFITQISL